MSSTEILAAKLKELAPYAEWGAAGIDRSLELAGILEQAGITDPTKMLLAKSTRTEAPKGKENQGLIFDQYAILYNGKRYGFLGEPGKITRDTAFLEEQNGRLAIAWSPAGHGAVTYYLQPTSDGFTFVPGWGSSSDAAEARFVAKFLGTAVLAAYAAPIAMEIGTAVMGAELAAAYPAIANAVGQVAITTAYNGGDVETAVKTAMLSQAGAAAGAAAGGAALSLTEIDAVAKLAASATQTLITGGDLKKSVTLSLLRSGAEYSPKAENMTTFNDFVQMDGPDFQMITPPESFNFYTPDFGGSFDTPEFGAGVGVDAGFYTPEFGPIVADNGFSMPSTIGPVDYQIPYLAPLEIPNIQIAEPPIIPVSDPIAATPWNAKETINTISQAALSAVSIYGAIQKINNPTINPVARNVNSRGALVSALDSGVVQTRAADGKISNQRPPIGVAQSTVTGNLIMNNGDGTYTLIDPQGTRRIIKYGEGSGSLLTDIPWGVLAAGVGVIGLVMRMGKNE